MGYKIRVNLADGRRVTGNAIFRTKDSARKAILKAKLIKTGLYKGVRNPRIVRY